LRSEHLRQHGHFDSNTLHLGSVKGTLTQGSHVPKMGFALTALGAMLTALGAMAIVTGGLLIWTVYDFCRCLYREL